jgi:hypothetical protein
VGQHASFLGGFDGAARTHPSAHTRTHTHTATGKYASTCKSARTHKRARTHTHTHTLTISLSLSLNLSCACERTFSLNRSLLRALSFILRFTDLSAVQEPVSKWQQVEGDAVAPDGGQGDHGVPAASDSSLAAAASKENNLLDLFYSDPTRLLPTCPAPYPFPPTRFPPLRPPLRHPGTALHICSSLCISEYLCLAQSFWVPKQRLA